MAQYHVPDKPIRSVSYENAWPVSETCQCRDSHIRYLLRPCIHSTRERSPLSRLADEGSTAASGNIAAYFAGLEPGMLWSTIRALRSFRANDARTSAMVSCKHPRHAHIILQASPKSYAGSRVLSILLNHPFLSTTLLSFPCDLCLPGLET